MVPEKDAAKVPFNPFDLTKVWPHKYHPLIDVGVLELNRLEIARHWRLQRHRYALVGEVRNRCGEKIFLRSLWSRTG